MQVSLISQSLWWCDGESYVVDKKWHEKSPYTTNIWRRPRSTTRIARSILSSWDTTIKKSPTTTTTTSTCSLAKARRVCSWHDKLGHWNGTEHVQQTSQVWMSYQAFYNEHKDHMPIQNLRVWFSTAEAMEIYFTEQDQSLRNRMDEIKTTRSWKNQEFRDDKDQLHDYYNSDDMWLRSCFCIFFFNFMFYFPFVLWFTEV